MTKRAIEIDLIDVVSPIFQNSDVARFGKLLDNAVHRTFANTHTTRNIAEAHVRLFGDADKNMRVITKESPGGEFL